MIINKIQKVLSLFEIKGISSIKLLFHKGFSLSSFHLIQAVGEYANAFGTILDIGANVGQFSIAAAQKFPKSEIISFEPVPNTFIKLKTNTKRFPNVRIYNFALGNQEGDIEFYENNYSHASSVLPISVFQKTNFPKTAVTKKIKVPIKKIEKLFYGKKLQGPILMKLDVQGFEKDVIEGAGELIHQIDYLLFETSFIQMYDGEPLFSEMHDFMNSIGFRLVAPVGFLQSEKSIILQMDMLYKRVK